MTTEPAGHQLFLGRVGHHRHGPEQHGFTYPVFFMGMDVDAMDAALQCEVPHAALPWPFRLNGFGLLAVRHVDHGARDGSALGPWMRDLLRTANLPIEAGHCITLHTFPRVLGLGFNPVSFWLCRDAHGQVRALLAEVNNTFGEHHNYLVARADGGPVQADDQLVARKAFHVSPFFPVQGRYQFRILAQGRDLQVRIDYRDEAGRGLFAYLHGSPQALTAGALTRAFVQHPLQTLTVLSRIHLHALRLWRKGVIFHKKPPAPTKEISIERT